MVTVLLEYFNFATLQMHGALGKVSQPPWQLLLEAMQVSGENFNLASFIQG